MCTIKETAKQTKAHLGILSNEIDVSSIIHCGRMFVLRPKYTVAPIANTLSCRSYSLSHSGRTTLHQHYKCYWTYFQLPGLSAQYVHFFDRLRKTRKVIEARRPFVSAALSLQCHEWSSTHISWYVFIQSPLIGRLQNTNCVSTRSWLTNTILLIQKIVQPF